MKYGFIQQINTKIPLVCDIAGVSRSGYYKWLKRAGGQEKDHIDYLLIKDLFDAGKAKYGWRTIAMKLRAQKGIVMNHKKIIRIKNKYGLMTRIRRRNPYKSIMKRTMENSFCKNTLNRKFRQKQPFRTLCTDIPYLPFHNKMIYLSAVKDIASREIVGWEVSQHFSGDIALKAIDHMVRNRPLSTFKDVLIHSDQGAHYKSSEYIKKIAQLNMVQSMSRKGRCIDNAPMESFFGHFKDDIEYKGCRTFDEVKAVIDTYIDYYNNERHQWKLKKMTPVEYRNHLLASPDRL